jgi:hypothetical protein
MTLLRCTILGEQNKILNYKKTVKKKCKPSLWFFIFSKTVYILTVTSLRCTILHIANKPKGCFVSTDVLSLRTFCPAGRFVSTDVLSLWMFCLYRCFVPTDVLSHGCYVSGCFVSGRFVSECFVPTDVLSGNLKKSKNLIYKIDNNFLTVRDKKSKRKIRYFLNK